MEFEQVERKNNLNVMRVCKLPCSDLRSTTTDNRLNHLMLLHVHKDKTDAINMVEVANQFVQRNAERFPIVGVFADLDAKPKDVSTTRSTQTAYNIK